MTENPEFDLDTELLSAELEPRPELEDAPQEQAAPVVMIQYRNRGVPPVLLFPATLILSLGMFAAYHYLFVAPRQRELQEQARVQASAAAAARGPVKVESADDLALKPPLLGLSLDSQPLPPGFQIPLPPPTFMDSETTRVAAKPVDVFGPNGALLEPATPKADAPAAVESATVAAEPREESAPPPTIGFSPPSAVATIAPPKQEEEKDASSPQPLAQAEAVKEEPAIATVATLEPKPSPTREEMMRALEAEAEANRTAHVEQNQVREQARVQVETEAQDRLEAERELFHDALKRVIDAGGPTSDAGQKIDELCDQFGRNYGGDLKAQVLGALSRFHGKISRDNEVKMMRSLGVPEAGILDYLANVLERRSINSRKGPGSQDEVRILAAKQLLRAKLSSSPVRGGTLAPAQVRRARPASSIRYRSAR